MRTLDFVLHRLYHDRYFPLDLSYFREAITQYAKVDARGKVVVDVGADYGCTPIVWVAGGALKVIAYEADRARRERMRRLLGSEPWLEINGSWDGETPEGDVIKIDCDGCLGEKKVTAESLLKHYSQVLLVHHEYDPTYQGSTTHQREVWIEYKSRKGFSSSSFTPEVGGVFQ
ncbi:MAG: hypothetical protein KGO96_13040 [Elusimicrobia bacterium]|nr:hypothetical protein [Elusimicrobiota bacterium]MDE2426819.1 hypothetical protein [Elusimicrobiota bacterium]